MIEIIILVALGGLSTWLGYLRGKVVGFQIAKASLVYKAISTAIDFATRKPEPTVQLQDLIGNPIKNDVAQTHLDDFKPKKKAKKSRR